MKYLRNRFPLSPRSLPFWLHILAFFSAFLTWGCQRSPELASAMGRLDALQQEHQRVLQERTLCQTQLHTQIEQRTVCTSTLFHCQTQGTQVPKASGATLCPKTTAAKSIKPLPANPPAFLQTLQQAETRVESAQQALVQAQARVQEQRKSVDLAKKALDKQQRPLGKERQDRSEDYLEAYPEYRKALDAHAEALRAYLAAQKQAEQALQTLLTSIQTLREHLRELPTLLAASAASPRTPTQ